MKNVFRIFVSAITTSILLSLTSCAGTVKSYEGPDKSPNEVATILGRTGFGAFTGSIGVEQIDKNLLRPTTEYYKEAPQSVTVLPGEHSITVEIKRSKFVQSKYSPQRNSPYICKVELKQCALKEGRTYQLDYHRRSQATAEDRWRGNIGVTLEEVGPGTKICEGTGVCMNF